QSFQEPVQSTTELQYNKDVIESVSYHDGLGRAKQQVAIKASPDAQDIVTYIEYDSYGRQAKQYLPFASSAAVGSYKTVHIENDINAYYKNKYVDDFEGITDFTQINAYSESVLEASPLNRVLEQGAPGKDWKADPNSDTDHTLKFDWDTNEANEVTHFKVTFANADTEKPQLVKEAYYPENTLQLTITKDENWAPNQTHPDDHTTREYTNHLGQVILKRTFNGGIEHDTYYVYDDYGNLTYVLPPKVDVSDGISNTELAELCYQYTYDYRNRMIEKKVSGKGREYIIYNKLDQPVMTQDALLNAESAWLFTKYDQFGRVAYTGKLTDNRERNIVQEEATAYTNDLWVERGNVNVIGGVTMYYTNGGYPDVQNGEVLTINYYDDYGFDTAGINDPGTVDGVGTTDRTQSLATGSKVKILDTNDWITTVTYYDTKGRPIYVASKNDYLNTTDIVESTLDFVGKVEETTTTHRKTGHEEIKTVDVFTYDHMGRLKDQKQTIGSHEETIVENSYDELGQLQSKTVGGGLQDVDYTYNVRGWLKGINDVNNLGDNLFGFAIEYNSNTNALYNGNISKTSWKTANDNIARSYDYTYDALNRILTATSDDNRYNVSGIQYDKMGNIESLTRNGWQNTSSYTNMDVLAYNYDEGNKLLKVTDNGNDNYGFKDGTNTNDDFDYDENGNMILDQNKGISSITYNYLNLPETVSISNNEGTGTISYIYDATGAKLKKIVTEGSSVTTEYAGKYVYKNGSLEFFNQPEGIVEKEADGYKYVYQFTDHLDNIRLSYKDANKDGTITQDEIVQEKNYYPFGLAHKGYNDVLRGRNHTYGFGSVEEQNELGLDWLDITARNYNPELGRWMNIDPLAEQMTRHSPYNYGFDNPVYFMDPDGMAPISATGAYGESFATAAVDHYQFGEISDAGEGIEKNNPPNKYKQWFDAKAQQYDEVLNDIDPIGQVNRGMKEGATNFFSDVLSAPAPKMDWLDWLLGPIGLITKQPFDFGQSVTNRVVEGDNFGAGYSLGSAFTGSAVGAGIGLGFRGLSNVNLTTSNGFLIGSVGFKLPINLRVGLFASNNTLKYQTFNWSTVAPKFFSGKQWFGRRMLQITPEFQSNLGPWSSQVIPKGTYVRFGLVGPQKGMGIGSWIQFYTSEGVKFKK
ncbi:DUF6443 domain-containing protein, partial [Aquimarina celericrescens]